MKKSIILTACLCGALIACENVEKKAGEHLTAARTAYEQGDYSRAKLLIDTIKTLYPKAYDTRRAGIHLMQEVELAEQTKTLAYLDSTLTAKQAELEKLKPAYTFEKDAEYQEIGNYLHPTQVIEKNLNRSFLRFMTDERGIMTMTGIYCGGRGIQFTALRVTATDGSFAETPTATDSYTTTDLGRTIEKADWRLGRDGGVIAFIAANRDKNLKVQYLGERPYSTTLTPNDRRAAASVYDLALLLSGMEKVRKEMEEARLKIQFVEKKMSERQTTAE